MRSPGRATYYVKADPLNVFNETALRHTDYAIKSAHAHNLRLIIELVDNWRYYLGGKHTFTDWRHIPDERYSYSEPCNGR